jgi:polyhydroxybutyrate depolymerase
MAEREKTNALWVTRSFFINRYFFFVRKFICENLQLLIRAKVYLSMIKTWILSLAISISFYGSVKARESISMDFKVDGANRETLVFPVTKQKTTKSKPVPLVFCFHGHGGGSRQASMSFRMHDEWPDAMVVYPQGLPTPGQLTDAEGKRNGWQAKQGDQRDKDLKFFDVMLFELSKLYPIDAKRVFVMGHSNGGGFTYLLWAYRGDKIAAVAPCAALSMSVVKDLKPKACLHIAGKNDRLVKFAWQEKMMSSVKDTNGCKEEGEVWAKHCLLYKPANEKVGAPMVQCIHDGTHRYPDDATELMVKFFKEVQIH